ncbi:MAG: DNA-processing protein DprA [Elusimicrobia bacterium]|nr:DNA-processing protein DprA [Candidatus Liberimonas magnetica]
MDIEKKAVITLVLLPEIGPVRFQNLINRFGSAVQVLNSSWEELNLVEDINENLSKKIARAKNEVDTDKEIELAAKLGINIVTCFEYEYPKALRNLYNYPAVVYIKGEIKDIDILSVGIVGTRHPTNYGRNAALQFAKDFAKYEVTTISGLARGIDTEVHSSTINAGGRTLAVLGNGLNRHYPPENRKLEEKIVKQGALISEFPLDIEPDRQNFPRRNRIISGLSLATLVVEADIKSGALITARYSVEQGKDVFAVPGPIFSKYSRGTHHLIKSGAQLVEGAKEVLESIEPLAVWLKEKESTSIIREKEDIELDQKGRKVMDILDNNIEGVSIDYFLENLDIPFGELSSTLVNLELKGILRSLPGKIYVKNH